MTDAEARDLQNALDVLKEIPNPSPREVAAIATLEAQRPDVESQVAASNSAWRGLQHGVSAGLLDEAAGVKSFVQGGGYSPGRDVVRDKDTQAYLNNPEEFTSGQMAGAGVTMFAPAVGWHKLTKGLGWGARSVYGALLGGGIGANQGIQDAQVDERPLDTPGDYFNAAKWPATIGAGIGMVAAPLGGVAGAGAELAARQRHRGVKGLNRKATAILSALTSRAGRSGRDIKRYLDSLKSEAMLADVPELTSTARGLSSMQGEGGQVLTRALNDRAEGSSVRIQQDMDVNINKPNAAFDERLRLANERTSQLGPEYDAALAHPGPVNLEDISETLAASQQNAAASVAAKMRAIEKDLGITVKTAADGTIEVRIPSDVSPAKLHNVRSELSDAIAEASRAGRGKFVVSMRPVLKALDDELDAIPGYARARTGYASNQSMERAIEEGTGALRGGRVSALSPDELRVKFDALSDAEKEAFRKGVRRDIAGLMGTSKNDAAAAWGEFAKTWNEEKLRIILGGDVADKIIARLKSENVFSRTRGEVTAGSQTNRGQAAMEALQPAMEPGTGRQQTVLSRVKETLLDRPGNAVINALRWGPRASRTNADLGRGFSATGRARDDILQALLAQQAGRDTDKSVGRFVAPLVEALLRSGGAAASAGAR